MTRPDNDTAILRALRSGLTTSTEIAAHAKVTERTAQLALVRMLDHEKVTRTRTAVGYEWKAVAT